MTQPHFFNNFKMNISAKANLCYRKGESIYSGWERLQLVVSFKERGKFFKTYLEKDLISTHNVKCDDYEKYYHDANKIIEKTDYLKDVATQMIQEYYKSKSKEFSREKSKKEIASKVNKMPSINISVRVK